MLVGYQQLQRRIAAIKGPVLGKPIMSTLAMATVRESKLLVHKKTANLARSIHAAEISESSARVVASAKYAAYVELGTRAHEITPRAKRALRWAASPEGRRLTGSPRSAAQRGELGGVVFATRVHHPGTKPHPFLRPGAEKAIKSAGLTDRIVAAWNGAA
jgi:hypothetical protein